MLCTYLEVVGSINYSGGVWAIKFLAANQTLGDNNFGS